jgi:two-component sensor histidine kinase
MEHNPERPAKEALRRGIARLQSIAVIHDLLQSRELRFVDIRQAATRIANLTCQTAAPEANIEVRVSGARVLLPSQQATIVAMVLSELVENAVQHGFSSIEAPQIKISLAEGGGNVVLEVRDNGIGLEQGFALDQAGVGLMIVKGLVEGDLGGSVAIEGNGGVTVRVRFNKHR